MSYKVVVSTVDYDLDYKAVRKSTIEYIVDDIDTALWRYNHERDITNYAPLARYSNRVTIALYKEGIDDAIECSLYKDNKELK